MNSFPLLKQLCNIHLVKLFFCKNIISIISAICIFSILLSTLSNSTKHDSCAWIFLFYFKKCSKPKH